jgi:hypothetical protein
MDGGGEMGDGSALGRDLNAGAGTNGEFEFEDTGEFEDAGQGEGEYYETDNEAPAAPTPNSGRGGRWVRRGRKIVLYGL